MPENKIQLDNHRVRVSEVTHEPGVARESYVRATDQIIVFLDHCRYQRIDAVSGATIDREREPGEILWHDRGETAPVLINVGDTPYRTLVIEIKS